MTEPSYYIPLAQAAEAAGYHAMTIPDSVAYPSRRSSSPPRSGR
jgi:alkanesulfonate monooxygenase SsuD/methylene tetrahydromethanopterin reductase-like flavin-dependent oxidoreductase (luciferase family)